MPDQEIKDPNSEQETPNSKDNKDVTDKLWSFCPVCGKKIPKLQKLKFCINCGTDLNYIKEYKQIKSTHTKTPYNKPKKYPKSYITLTQYDSKRISDEDILNTKNIELWGIKQSIGISLGAFLLMDLITTGVLAIIIFLSFNLEALYDLASNPYFIIFSTFFELIFILVPVLYVGKYLKNPSLKNRFRLLGFTVKGLSRKGIFKEILIGLGFAVIGIILVTIVSFLTEITLEFFFGVEIIRNLSGTTSEFDILISEGNVFGLILISLVMISIVGTSEEILFRGFMQKGLMRSLGNTGGILITAFIFAMLHVLGIVLLFFDAPMFMLISFLLSFAPYIIISLLLGLIYYWRNENLIAVVLTHGVYNALTIIMAYVFYYAF
ncbi:MAG: type II CAAX prenyl endopeptidase Rce1 family protein [Candidatus Odinarchaeota archaeon]